MTKRKMSFFFTVKGLSNKPFFNSSTFHFIGTLMNPFNHGLIALSFSFRPPVVSNEVNMLNPPSPN